MSVPHSEDWLERRRKGIGGSDWQDVLGLEPYGCARRLWYDKRSTPLDFPRRYTGAMKRGHKLEALVAEEVTEKYGIKFARPGKLRKIRWLPPWWIGNIDRRVVAGSVAELTGPGVAEFKTKGPFPFANLKQAGVPDIEKMQVQHYLAMTGWTWGLYACLEPVSWQLYVTFIERDEAAINLMHQVGERFMREVTEGPAPFQLMPTDKRCQTCEFRWTCQGTALFDAVNSEEKVEEIEDPELSRLIEERDGISEALKNAEQLLDENTRLLKSQLGGYRKVKVGNRPLIWQVATRKSLDSRRLQEEKPDIYNEYVRETSYDFFRLI